MLRISFYISIYFFTHYSTTLLSFNLFFSMHSLYHGVLSFPQHTCILKMQVQFHKRYVNLYISRTALRFFVSTYYVFPLYVWF